MNRGGVLRWAARRLPGVEPSLRHDLIASVDELADRGSRTDRALEVGSLIGFVLRSTSRRGASDSRDELIRQGVRVGALVLAIAGALRAWSGAADATGAILAGGVSVVAVAISGGLRRSALVLAAAYVAVEVAVAGETSVMAVVVVAAVAIGHRFDARPCPIGAAVTAAAITAGALASTVLPSTTTNSALTVATAIIPVGLLAVGWFDPRYAMAATVVWLWRFVVLDVDLLGAARDAVAEGPALRLLLARWLLMGAGVWAAWQVTNAAIDRCLTERRRR